MTASDERSPSGRTTAGTGADVEPAHQVVMCMSVVGAPHQGGRAGGTGWPAAYVVRSGGFSRGGSGPSICTPRVSFRRSRHGVLMTPSADR